VPRYVETKRLIELEIEDAFQAKQKVDRTMIFFLLSVTCFLLIFFVKLYQRYYSFEQSTTLCFCSSEIWGHRRRRHGVQITGASMASVRGCVAGTAQGVAR
jgi:hypothetical protein